MDEGNCMVLFIYSFQPILMRVATAPEAGTRSSRDAEVEAQAPAASLVSPVHRASGAYPGRGWVDTRRAREGIVACEYNLFFCVCL